MNRAAFRCTIGLSIAFACTAASGARAADAAASAAGHALASARCGACHSVERQGDSPMAAAPPFRTLARNYPPENLEEALAEGIFAGHPDMPDDPWEPADIERLIAYLKAIQAP